MCWPFPHAPLGVGKPPYGLKNWRGQKPLGCCFWDAERLSNLAEAQLGGIAEQHDRAVARGQRLKRLKEQLAYLVQFDLFLWLPVRAQKRGKGRTFVPI